MKRHPALARLSREHHPALVLAKRCQRFEPEPAGAPAAFVGELLRLFADELEPHFCDEESRLLPALASAGEGEAVARTLAEHGELRALIAAIRAGDRAGVPRFGRKLAEHVRFEENTLFPLAESVLSGEVIAVLTSPPAMRLPAFFDAVPRLALHDPLALFLGAAEGGRLDYGYADAVRLAGHSCPTVAAAYWLTCRALKALYDEDLPRRGDIRVEFREAETAGVTGVMAKVVGLLTGAAGEDGFKGIAGHFERRRRLVFGAAIPLDIRFRRLDTGAAVDAAAHLARVPAAPEMAPLMQAAVAGQASVPERQRFGELWQARVRRILIDHRDDPEVFEIRRAV